MILEKLNYDNGFHNERVKAMVANIKAQFDVVTLNFFKSATVKDVFAGAKVVENFENLDHAGSFLVKGKKDEIVVWGKPDSVITSQGKHIAIIWKTGNGERNLEIERFHAQVIAIYLTKQYGVKLNEMEVRIEDLQAGEVRTYTIEDKAHHAAILKEIGISIGKMAKYTDGKDIKANSPLPMESFPMKDDHSKCRQCRYLSLCREQAKKTKEAKGDTVATPITAKAA